MKTTPKIELKFECNQDWDAMKLTACGRFCDVCKKEVKDFTKEKNVYEFLKDPSGDISCGRFLPEQLDPSLIRPMQFPFAKQVAIYLTGFLFTVAAKNVSAQNDTAQTEQTTDDESASINSGTIHIKKPEVIQEDFSDNRFYSNYNFYYNMQTNRPITGKKWYWSWRFPFIRRVRRQTMGMQGRFL